MRFQLPRKKRDLNIRFLLNFGDECFFRYGTLWFWPHRNMLLPNHFHPHWLSWMHSNHKVDHSTIIGLIVKKARDFDHRYQCYAKNGDDDGSGLTGGGESLYVEWQWFWTRQNHMGNTPTPQNYDTPLMMPIRRSPEFIPHERFLMNGTVGLSLQPAIYKGGRVRWRGPINSSINSSFEL